jgi:hypothetical protein
MQATNEESHIVHRCEQCGTVVMIARPTGATENNLDDVLKETAHDNAE